MANIWDEHADQLLERSWTPRPANRPAQPTLQLSTRGTVLVLLAVFVLLCAALVVGQRRLPEPTFCETAAAPGHVAECRAQTGSP